MEPLQSTQPGHGNACDWALHAGGPVVIGGDLVRALCGPTPLLHQLYILSHPSYSA